jgi:CDP-glucose 4,6-dehydratase
VEDLAVTDRFWQDRKVFLTGHTGFKGAWLSLWLQSLNARVTGYALADEPDPKLRMFEIVDAESGMTHVTGDVRNRAALLEALTKAQPEVVFHMAAQPLVRRSYREAAQTFETNVMGTVNLLDACRQCASVQAVVVVTTDKCYENREWVWGYREHEAMGGHDPYSASKGCAELVTAAYRRSFFTPDLGLSRARVASARAGNVIGGGDWAEDRLIPDIVRAFASDQEAYIRFPHATRPWQHVLEPLSGYLLLAQRLVENGSANRRRETPP